MKEFSTSPDVMPVGDAPVNRNLGNRVSSNEKSNSKNTTPSMIAHMYWLHLQPTVSAMVPPDINPRLGS